MRAETICLIFAFVIDLATAKPSIQNAQNKTASYNDKNPCFPTPCGVNSFCLVVNGKAVCSCPPDYFGDPTVGCRPECITNADCAWNMLCINQRCKDSCPTGSCGRKADCKIVSHIPICSCPPSRTGDPFVYCKPIEGEDRNACSPSPCGPNSTCTEENYKAICSCLPGHTAFSDPTVGCRPECTDDSECSANSACINGACRNPCASFPFRRDACGIGARCLVVNHKPVCNCPEGMTGDPFSGCVVIDDDRKACTTNSDCPSNLACIRQECLTPCLGGCGVNARCDVVNQTAICTCREGTSGDPFISCRTIEEKCATDSDCPSNLACVQNICTNPCSSRPCGLDSRCDVVDHIARCTCLDGFTGNPSKSCDIPHGHACTANFDCASDQACFNQTCIDPCPGACGKNAQCDVVDHITKCTCPDGMTGNPYTNGCTTTNKCVTDSDCSSNQTCSRQKCTEGCPGFCGKNAQCDVVNKTLICTCPEGMNGDPYKECKILQDKTCATELDCNSNEACIKSTCADPCVDYHCGSDAVCVAGDHYVYCSCPPGTSGNPYKKCIKYENVCSPSPCGPYSQCQIVNKEPVCSCSPGYAGSPPFCKSKCTDHSDCGPSSRCERENNVKVCQCPGGYVGAPPECAAEY